MNRIIEKTKKILKKKGYTAAGIEYLLSLMNNTCVACKHSGECRANGVIQGPYHKKCKLHEFREDTVFLNK